MSDGFWDHEEEVPCQKVGLTPENPGGKSKHQRMPPEPAAGSLLPSEKATAKNQPVRDGIETPAVARRIADITGDVDIP